MKLIVYLSFALSVSAQPQPRFDVASIKLDSGIMAAPRFGPTSVSFRHITLQDLLVQAYQIDLWQLEWRAGGDHVWYDVDAKWDNPSLKNEWPKMLRALLLERFSLKAHTEYRPTNLYTLSVDPKKSDLLEKCRATDSDVAHRGIDLGFQGQERMTFTGEYLNTIWQSAGIASGMKMRIVRDTGIEGLYTMSIDKPDIATPEELLFAARGSFAKCGLVIRTVEKVVPYLVVTSVGKLIAN